MTSPHVVVLDYGSGNVRSAVRALERAGAEVELTADFKRAVDSDGLVVPGVGAFASVVEQLREVGGHRMIGRRLAGGRPVLGICVGLQVLFDKSAEFGRDDVEGLGEWPGTVERLASAVVPHMGWNTVQVPENSVLFQGIEQERFYFVHSYGVQKWELLDPGDPLATLKPPLVTWSDHGGRFVAAVENGALMATQFHPEKSGEAGIQLLRNWLGTLN